MMTREDYEAEVMRIAKTCAFRAHLSKKPLGAIVFSEVYEHRWLEDNCSDIHADILKFTSNDLEAQYRELGKIMPGELSGDGWAFRLEVAATIAMQNDVWAQALPILDGVKAGESNE